MVVTHGLIKTVLCHNGRLRDECSNVPQFTSMTEPHQIIDVWRPGYNHRRLHNSLGHLTPNEFVVQRQGEETTKMSTALVKTVSEWGRRQNPEALL